MTSSSAPTSLPIKKVIYDLGANKGDNISYYLKKADVVVAVEANPELCKSIRERFSDAIQQGRLFVESCVVVENESDAEVYFYLHKQQSEYSRFPVPDQEHIAEFEKIKLPSISVKNLIIKYGDPYYIKIDIEHYDQIILRALFENGVRPPFISAEAQTIEVFSVLVALGGYRSYKLVDGESVSKRFKCCAITTGSGTESYSFPFGSAGPFGEDLTGEWMTTDNFFTLLAYEKLGWKDIHATNQIEATPDCRPKFIWYIHEYIKQQIKPFVPKPLRPLLWNILFHPRKPKDF